MLFRSFFFFILFSARGERATLILARAERVAEFFSKVERETEPFLLSFPCSHPSEKLYVQVRFELIWESE